MENKILDWDSYFMAMAHLSAKRSKDPSTQVGSVIVNQQNRIVGIGYNGFPSGCEDNCFPWGKTGEFLATKYPYVVHAELNAILNANQIVRGCTLYVSLFPCNECAKAIIQAGISKIVYESNKYKDTQSVQASLKMLQAAKITLVQLPQIVQVDVKTHKN